MFASRQVPQSDVLVQLHSAKRVFVRLALSHQEQGGWLARGLVVDILPQRWLDNPNISENITGPWWKPTYLFDAERAIFFRGFLSGSQVYDWFTSPAGSALVGFDRRPGHGSHKDSFALPDLHDTVQEQRQPSYGGWIEVMPYPSTVYTFQQKPPYQPPNSDLGALIGWDSIVGEGKYYRDFRTAQAELILGKTNHLQTYNIDDLNTVRVIHAEGWIQEVRVLPDKAVVTVSGTDIIGKGFVVLDGLPELNVREPIMDQQVILPLPEDLPQATRVVLIRGSEEVDEAVFYTASPPYPAGNSPQVIVERADVLGYQGKPAEDEAEPSPGDSFQEGAEQVGASAPTVQIVPFELVAGAPGYIQKVVYQINRTYETDCYDACAVMIRRLIETLIIEAFERNGIADNIKGNVGEYLPLGGLIGKALFEKSWHLSRNTQQPLAKFKEVGDVSAHNPRVNLVRDDIANIAFGVRVVVEELLVAAKLK